MMGFREPVRWLAVAGMLRAHPLGCFIRFSPAQVEHPRDAGMKPSLGLPLGQRADYRLDVGNGQVLVVSEFSAAFEARLEARPDFADLERMLRDAPGSTVMGMVAAGALLGLALGRSKDSALAGATIGGLAALAGVGVANAQSAPEVSAAALKLLGSVRSSTPPPTASPPVVKTLTSARKPR